LQRMKGDVKRARRLPERFNMCVSDAHALGL
jgi:hypothetical protein